MKQDVKKILPTWRETAKHLPLTLRSAILGVLVGALPGAGGDIAALFAYDQAKRTVRNAAVPFGEGAIEGVIAPETANNAAIGGAFIPMLTLGIPGDAITAVLISALAIHGVQPGPALISNTPGLFYLIVGCLLAAALFLLLFGLTGIRLFTKIIEVPKGILLPIILVLCVVGAYAIRNSMADIFWMFCFALLGYLFKRFDYPVAPVVLGIILSGLFEDNFRRGILLEGSAGGLLLSVFKSPLSAVLFALLALLLVTQSARYKTWRAQRSEQRRR